MFEMKGVVLFIGIIQFVLLVTSSTINSEGVSCKPGHEDWICQKPEKCSEKPETSSVCKSQPGAKFVCCPSNTVIDLHHDEIRKLSKREAKPVGAKAQEMCEKYSEAAFTTLSVSVTEEDEKKRFSSCGISQSPLIIDGEDANPKEFPHMVLVGHGDNPTLWLCGGSLISDEWVLSAAHCTSATHPKKNNLWTLAKWILLGDLKVGSDDDMLTSSPKHVEVIKRINHPDYKRPAPYNDIALYKLKEKITFNEYIRPLCLYTQEMINEKSAITAGWGMTKADNASSVSHMLQKVTLDLIKKPNLCKEKYLKSKKVSERLTNGIDESKMLCAWTKGKDSCEGDSGGPLMNILEKPFCMYGIIGVVSFGENCAGTLPGVYTRIYPYVEWIEKIVWP